MLQKQFAYKNFTADSYFTTKTNNNNNCDVSKARRDKSERKKNTKKESSTHALFISSSTLNIHSTILHV